MTMTWDEALEIIFELAQSWDLSDKQKQALQVVLDFDQTAVGPSWLRKGTSK